MVQSGICSILWRHHDVGHRVDDGVARVEDGEEVLVSDLLDVARRGHQLKELAHAPRAACAQQASVVGPERAH
eukprot:1222345-Lingulodinium_polyedra.AAC.1